MSDGRDAETRESIAQLGARLSMLWATPVTVSGVSTMAGGASRQTAQFTATCSAGARELVLRVDRAGTASTSTMAREATAMRAAAAVGVPVPEVVDEGISTSGHPYLVMSHVAGETIPRRLLRDEQFARTRTTLAAQLGAIAARIHAADPAGIEPPECADPLHALRKLSDRYDGGRPTVELALRWLADNRPPRVADTLVHGDLRNGNVMVGPDGIRAVLDWELVHRGDPVEDLGWLCVKAWRFGAALPVGGFGSRAQLLDGYQSVAGWRPADEQLHWWEVYSHLRWILICRHQAAVHLRGTRDSLEHAVIGRRVCEAEFDLLLALGHATPESVVDPLDALDAQARNTLDIGRVPHDAPDADQLLAVVARALLNGEIGAAPTGKPEFLARVGANAIRVARRENLLGVAIATRHRDRLAELGSESEADLAAALRTGTLDARSAHVVRAIVATVRDKLLVANPSYLNAATGIR